MGYRPKIMYYTTDRRTVPNASELCDLHQHDVQDLYCGSSSQSSSPAPAFQAVATRVECNPYNAFSWGPCPAVCAWSESRKQAKTEHRIVKFFKIVSRINALPAIWIFFRYNRPNDAVYIPLSPVKALIASPRAWTRGYLDPLRTRECRA